MAFVSDIMGFIDTAISGSAKTMFTAVSSGYGNVIVILAVLAFAAFGLSVALGVVTARTGDITQLVLRIILVFTFGLSWTNFQVIYDGMTGVGDGLVRVIFAAARSGIVGAPQTSVSLMDDFSGQAQEMAAVVIKAESSIARGVLGALMYVLLSLLSAVYILVAGFAKIMIGILIGLAPFAIASTCLKRTQFLFEAWLSALVGYFMYPVAAAAVVAFVTSVAATAFDAKDTSALVGITGFIVIIIIAIFALGSIPNIASNITGQLNLGGIAPQALNIVKAPFAKAGSIAKGAAGQFASGYSTGGETKQKAEQLRRFGSKSDIRMANAGAHAANNMVGKFVQRRRDLSAAKASNERLRSKP